MVNLTLSRLSKAILVGAIACFFSLVVFNNITDYGTNFAYVQHVLMMDTISPDSTLTWRAITNPYLHHAVYWSIISWEALTALCCWVGVWQFCRNWRAEAAQFQAAKSYVLVGLTASCILWLLAFFCIGGEWFAMWQSPVWNGQQTGFRMFIISIAVLLWVQQPE
jgi:predicted small integral membrane protein